LRLLTKSKTLRRINFGDTNYSFQTLEAFVKNPNFFTIRVPEGRLDSAQKIRLRKLKTNLKIEEE